MEYGMFRILRAFLGVFLSSVISLFSTSISLGNDRITVNPAVFEGDESCYCIMWETSKKGSGYVRYTFDGEEKTIYDEISGIRRNDDTVHRVFVPKEELRNNDYTVGSQYIGFKYAYDAITGETVESDAIHFTGTEKEDDIEILCVSDVLGRRAALKAAVCSLSFTPDLIVMNGDISPVMENKKDFSENIINSAAILSGGSIPVAFVRGDHETEGEFAPRIYEYLPSNTGGLYYNFNFGSLSAAVLDTADNKKDSAFEHSGLTDFSAYCARENEWIESLAAEDFPGEYKLVFSHIPSTQDCFDYDFITPFASLGFDAQVSGHIINAGRIEGPVPVFCSGGFGTGCRTARITLSEGTVTFTVSNIFGIPVFSDVLATG